MAHASEVVAQNDEQTVQKLSVKAALTRSFFGRRVRDIAAKHYERLNQFGFKALKSAQYYAPSALDAAFDGPMTSPTGTAASAIEQTTQPSPQSEGRTFKWKGLPALDEADLDREIDGASVATELEVALNDFERSCTKMAAVATEACLRDEQAVALIEVLARSATRLAEITGHVLTVETRPCAKLAMGSYETVIDVRVSNEVYRARYRLEAEAKEAPEVPVSPVVLGHPLRARAGKADYSPTTLELARRALEARDNDTRTEEQKISDAAAFVCDTRLDQRPTASPEPVSEQPISVHPQLEEHQGTTFETYEFSDGAARIMTRTEFDAKYGRTLRIYLERCRSNRHANESATPASSGDTAGASTRLERDLKASENKANGTCIVYADDVRALLAASSVAGTARMKPTPVTDDMVSKFLGWKLPQDFYPDCHIAFDREKASAQYGSWPSGTNLLHAGQARAMLEHVLAATFVSSGDTAGAKDRAQVIDGDFGTYEHPYLTNAVDYHPV